MVCYQTLRGIGLPVREFFLNSRSQRTARGGPIEHRRSELIVLEFCAGSSRPRATKTRSPLRARLKIWIAKLRQVRTWRNSGKLSKIFFTQYRAHGLKLHDAHELRDLISRMDTKARRDGRGRDEDCSSPPAQIPACAANAPGSSLGFWRRSDDRAKGAAF